MSYPLYVKVCIGLLLLVLLIFGLTEASEFLIPFTIAVLLSFILLPVSRRIENIPLPRWAGAFFSVLLAIIILSGVTWLIYMQVRGFASDMPEIKEKISERATAFQHFLREQFNVSEDDQSQWLDKKISTFVNSA